MTVSLLEILAAARAHVAPLAAESAGYLLLAVADHIAVAPRLVEPSEVELSADGAVRLSARRGAVGADAAEQNVRRLLARALEVSSSVGPALRRAAHKTEDAGLPALVRELEVALIPVNRSAAKRALSRLHRETERARDTGKLAALLDVEVKLAPPVVVAEAPPVVVAPPVMLAADFPDPSTVAPPVVAKAPSRRPAPPPAPSVELTLTPEPRIAVGEAVLTKPEPVILRAKERGAQTPRLGTVVTAQTLVGEEHERTQRTPPVIESEAEPEPEQDFSIDVEVEPETNPLASAAPALVPAAEPLALAQEPQPLADPEPSCMPDVLTAMMALHTGFDPDEAPTRLREVVTALIAPAPQLLLTPEPPVVETAEPPVLLTPEPEHVDDAWLTQSSLSGVVTSAPQLFVSELADPALHEALTWNPGPVVPVVVAPPPAALFITEPAPEPSPYAPAVLPSRQSDVSELLDSFYVSGGAEEQELRSALKEMAGLELTPMPHPLVEER